MQVILKILTTEKCSEVQAEHELPLLGWSQVSILTVLIYQYVIPIPPSQCWNPSWLRTPDISDIFTHCCHRSFDCLSRFPNRCYCSETCWKQNDIVGQWNFSDWFLFRNIYKFYYTLIMETCKQNKTYPKQYLIESAYSLMVLFNGLVIAGVDTVVAGSMILESWNLNKYERPVTIATTRVTSWQTVTWGWWRSTYVWSSVRIVMDRNHSMKFESGSSFW